jgi:hypothetical protein
MLAIYVFKVNALPTSMLKIGLAIFCVLLCTCALVLPERTVSFSSFSLEDLDESLLKHLFTLQSSSSTSCLTSNKPADSSLPKTGSESTHKLFVADQNRAKTTSEDSTPLHSQRGVEGSSSSDSLTNLTYSKTNERSTESTLLANTLIKKINCENHCRTGKLNPLYEEDLVATSSLRFKRVYFLFAKGS